MTNFTIDHNLLLDFEAVTEADITLTTEQIERAAALSEPILSSQRQWQTYLDALALWGFVDWLEERDASISVNLENCSVTQPHYANYIDGVFNLEVGGFKVCLLNSGVILDDTVTIPRAILDLPQYTAHYYVVLNVVEERGEVAVSSFISRDEILERIQASSLTADTDWTYEVPVAWFNSEPDDLLLYLRCLNPQAITLPEASVNNNLVNLQNELEAKISQLQSSETALSEVLTWEQGAQLLANPNLLAWLYELQSTTVSQANAVTSLRNSFNTAIEEVRQRAINVKTWLDRELDEIAQNLAWNLLPAPAFATSQFRDLQVINRESPVEEFEAIVTQLRNSGEDIPAEASGAYQNFNLSNFTLRLFAVTWEETTGNDSEWNLLIILGSQAGSYIPQGLKLELKLENEVLDEKIAETDTDDTYLYTRVIGELEEQFTVTITLANGENITFPNFVFQ